MSNDLKYIIVPKELLTDDLLKSLMAKHGDSIHSLERELGFSAGIIMNPQYQEGRLLKNFFDVECFDAAGNLKWRDQFSNLVVNVGLDDSLDKHLKGSAYTAAWYVGLTGATPSPAAGHTMASHTGWTDDTTYSNATRPVLTLGTVSGQSVDNSASKAQFNINGTATIGGAFVVDDNTKGGTSGILYGVGAFSGGNRSVVNGDTVNVTVTLTAAAS